MTTLLHDLFDLLVGFLVDPAPLEDRPRWRWNRKQRDAAVLRNCVHQLRDFLREYASPATALTTLDDLERAVEESWKLLETCQSVSAKVHLEHVQPELREWLRMTESYLAQITVSCRRAMEEDRCIESVRGTGAQYDVTELADPSCIFFETSDRLIANLAELVGRPEGGAR